MQVCPTRLTAHQETAAEQAPRVAPARLLLLSSFLLPRFRAKCVVQLGETTLSSRPGLVVDEAQIWPLTYGLLCLGDWNLFLFPLGIADRRRFPPLPTTDVFLVCQHPTHLLRVPARIACTMVFRHTQT